MITLIIILVALSLAGGYVFTNRKKIWIEPSETHRYSSFSFKHLGVGILIAVIGFLSAVIQPFSLERVDAGHVGIKVNLTGDSRGVSKFEYKTGWVIINDWVSKLYEFPTFQQHIEYPEQSVITKGGFEANIKPSFNYALKAGDIGDMFSNLRLPVKDIEQQWLQTAIVSSVNDVANRWNVDDIFNRREQFETDILKEVNKRTFKWFTVSQLRTNIVPPKALQASIEAKTKAVQEAQAAESQKFVAIAMGETKIAEARADSAQRVIRAAGEAEEMRRKQVVLSREYVEFLKVQKWDGKLPTVSSGNSGILLNMKQE
jgi:regulator of protease activity HflC (stomatin/prohibitin superfamily)